MSKSIAPRIDVQRGKLIDYAGKMLLQMTKPELRRALLLLKTIFVERAEQQK